MSLEAVEAICAGDGLDTYDILDLLSELVNKSLVIAQRQQGRTTRYHLLETIRQYAQEKLAQAEQVAAFRQRHLGYFCTLGEAAKLALIRSEQGVWMKRLEWELDNVRAALSWAMKADPESGLRLAGSLYRFWNLGHKREGTSWLAQLLAEVKAITPEVKAKALWVRGMVGHNTLNADSVYKLAEESLALYRDLEDQKGIACGLFLLGTVISWDQGLHKGKPYYQESLALFTALKDPFWTAEVLMYLGLFEAETSKNFVEALAHLKESELRYREMGHLAGIAAVLNVSAAIAIWQGNYALAHLKLDECLSLEGQLGHRGSPESFMWLGWLHFWLGEYAQAKVYLENSVALSRQMGNNSIEFCASSLLGNVFLRCHEYFKAQDILRENLRTFKEKGVAAAGCVIFTLEMFAGLAVRLEEPERATRLFAWADAGRAAWQNVRPINEQKAVERDMAAIQEMIDKATFDAAYAEGKAMTVEEAIAYALEG
jgi:tetratricopeptide (TPR) repeat protein